MMRSILKGSKFKKQQALSKYDTSKVNVDFILVTLEMPVERKDTKGLTIQDGKRYKI